MRGYLEVQEEVGVDKRCDQKNSGERSSYKGDESGLISPLY